MGAVGGLVTIACVAVAWVPVSWLQEMQLLMRCRCCSQTEESRRCSCLFWNDEERIPACTTELSGRLLLGANEDEEGNYDPLLGVVRTPAVRPTRMSYGSVDRGDAAPSRVLGVKSEGCITGSTALNGT